MSSPIRRIIIVFLMMIEAFAEYLLSLLISPIKLLILLSIMFIYMPLHAAFRIYPSPTTLTLGPVPTIHHISSKLVLDAIVEFIAGRPGNWRFIFRRYLQFLKYSDLALEGFLSQFLASVIAWSEWIINSCCGVRREFGMQVHAECRKLQLGSKVLSSASRIVFPLHLIT